MPIQGTGLSNKNIRFRFFALVFMGIIALGSVLYWRSQELASAEYVDFPSYDAQAHKSNVQKDLHSKNFNLEVEESSPTVQ